MKKTFLAIVTTVCVLTISAFANAADLQITLDPTTFPTTEACNPLYYTNCPTQEMTATVKATYLDFRHILQINSVSLDGLGGSVTITEDKCSGKKILMLASCTIKLSFQPLLPSHYQTNLKVDYSLGATADSVYANLEGQGYASAPHVYPPMINFGSKALNSAKEWLYVEILNQSRTSIEISDTVINSRLSDPAFGVNTTCKDKLLEPEVEPEGSTCNMGVSFHPTDPTKVDTTINGFAEVFVKHLIGDQQVNLVGKVTAAATKDVKLSAAGLYFGDQTIGTTSAVKSFTITNIGSLNVVMGEITSSLPEFTIEHDCPGVGVELNPGDVCTVDVEFSPDTVGQKSGLISVENDATGNPQEVSISGNGIDPEKPSVSLSSNYIDFGHQTVGINSKQYVTLINKGGANLVIGKITITGDDQFVVTEPDTDCDNNTISPNSRCKITISYETKSAGDATATIKINDNAEDTPQEINVEGTGVKAKTPSVALSATELDFGNQTIDTSESQTLTITNSGTSDLQISLTSIDGEGSFAFNKLDGCRGTIVQAGSTCVIDINFYPTDFTTYSATLNIDENSADSPQSVTLTGAGVPSNNGGGCAIGNNQHQISIFALIIMAISSLLILKRKTIRTQK